MHESASFHELAGEHYKGSRGDESVSRYLRVYIAWSEGPPSPKPAAIMSDLAADISKLAVSNPHTSPPPAEGRDAEGDTGEKTAPDASLTTRSAKKAIAHINAFMPATIRPSLPPHPLTQALVSIYAHSIHPPPLPLEILQVADQISRRLSCSEADPSRWRVEYKNEVAHWPTVGERRTARLIVWPWTPEGETPKWAAEMMVHLLVGEQAGKLESAAWRFGPGAGSGPPEDFGDWRMIHRVKYFAIEVQGDKDNVVRRPDGTQELARIELAEGVPLLKESAVDLIHRAVKAALGKPFDPDRKELEDRLRRVSTRLERDGKEPGCVKVTRGFRQGIKGQFLPAAFVEVHRRGKGQPETGKESGASASAQDRADAVILIDVFGNGKVKLMGVMFEDEQPIAHFYRSRYPPPDPSSIQRAGEQQRGTISLGQAVKQGAAGQQEQGLVQAGSKMGKAVTPTLEPVAEDET